MSNPMTAKPDIAAIREKVAEIQREHGGKAQIEEWEHNGQGGLRVLITWRYDAQPEGARL